MGLRLENLIIAADKAVEVGAKYFAIRVKIKDDSEIIINKMEAVKAHKLEYWKNTYDENLKMKVNSSIQIVGFTFGDSFDSIEKDLVG